MVFSVVLNNVAVFFCLENEYKTGFYCFSVQHPTGIWGYAVVH